MPNSLRAQITHLKAKGKITRAEYDWFMKKAYGHDQKIKEEAYKQGRADALREHDKQIRAEVIEEFATDLKEQLNQEFPINYHCLKPYFSLENARLIVDEIAEQLKESEEV